MDAPRDASTFLSQLDLSHLTITDEDLTECCSIADSAGGRVEMLSHMKQIGISKLADRQKLANAIGRERGRPSNWALLARLAIKLRA